MKQKMTALLLSLALALSLWVPASAAVGGMNFTDVKTTQWYYTYVKDLYNAGIVNGTTPTTFSPGDTVTLGQALKLILLASGYPEQAPTTTHWASGYYSYAREKDFFPSGVIPTLEDPVSRMMIAEITAAATGLSRTEHTRPFADTSNVSAFILYDHGIFTGSTENGRLLFKPDDFITRAEISAVIWRIQQLKKDTPTPPPAPDTPTTPDTPTVPDTPTTPTTPDDPGSATDPDPGDSTDPGSTTTGPYFMFRGHKVPITAGLARRPYDSSLFQKNKNGFLTYNSDDYSCKIGVDVSRYQGNIDWKAVKAAGVDFAMIRVGYRGYGTGALALDTCFTQNIKGALAAGVEVGVYFFSQAITTAEAVEEAQYTLNLIQKYNVTYPVVFDWEPYSSSVNARTNGLSDKTLTRCAAAFCDTVVNAGYIPMVYSNLTYFYLHLDLSKLKDYPFWLAQYTSKPTFYYNFVMWQYTGEGTVPGISGNTDLNICFVPKI